MTSWVGWRPYAATHQKQKTFRFFIFFNRFWGAKYGENSHKSWKSAKIHPGKRRISCTSQHPQRLLAATTGKIHEMWKISLFSKIWAFLGTHKSVFFSKKVVVWFEKLGRLCVAKGTKRWSFASPKAANPLPYDACEDHADLYGGIAALGFVNGHLFLSSATKICPNFSNQTTTFLEKKTDLRVPNAEGNPEK